VNAARRIPPALQFAWRRILGNDLFISYSRSDAGRNYAHALAVELQARGYEVLMDTLEARPSPETPESLLRAMAGCMQLIVVASPAAIGSKEVGKEVERFPKSGRSIILLEFNQCVREAAWYREHVSGLPPVRVAETLEERPSKQTVDLIVNAFRFKRTRQIRAAVAAVTALVTLALSAGALLLNHQVQSQRNALGKAETDLKVAGQRFNDVEALRKKAEIRLGEAETAATLAGELAAARRRATDIETRRRDAGFTAPSDVRQAAEDAGVLASHGQIIEAQSLLVSTLQSTPRFVRTLHIPMTAAPAILPAGTVLLAPDGRRVRQWDYRTGRETGPPLSHTSTVLGVSMSADGALVLTTTKSTAHLWALSGAAEIANRACAEFPFSAALSRSGRWLGVGCGEQVYLFDVRAKTWRPQPASLPLSVRSLEFSSDDRWLYTVLHDEADSLSVVDLESGQPARRNVTACETGYRAFVLSPGAAFLATTRVPFELGVAENDIRVCELLPPAKQQRTSTAVQLPHLSVADVGISPALDAVLTRDGSTGTIRVWGRLRGELYGTLPVDPARTAGIRDQPPFTFTPDGRYVLNANAARTWVFDLPIPSVACVVPHLPASFSKLSPDGHLVIVGISAGPAQALQELWECEPAARSAGLQYRGLPAVHLSRNLDRLLLADDAPQVDGNHESHWRLFRLPEGVTLREGRARFLEEPESFALSPDGRRLAALTATSDSAAIHIFHEGATPPVTTTTRTGQFASIAYLPGLDFVVAELRSDERGADEMIWTRLDGTEVRRWRAGNHMPKPLPNGGYFHAEDRLFDVAAGLTLRLPARFARSLTGVARSAGGQYHFVFCSSSGATVLRRAASSESATTILEVAGPCEAAALSESAGMAAIAGSGNLTVWDLKGRRPAATFRFEGKAQSAFFDSTGRVVGLAAGRRVQLWQWRLDDLAGKIAELVRQNAKSAAWKNSPLLAGKLP
jgi:hypothetical protein